MKGRRRFQSFQRAGGRCEPAAVTACIAHPGAVGLMGYHRAGRKGSVTGQSLVGGLRVC